MIAIVFLVLLAAGFNCCGTSKALTTHKNCKQELKDWLADKWFYNTETNTYRETRETIGIQNPTTTRDSCWQTMTRADAIDLLGEPSREDSIENRMFYFYFKEDFDRFDSVRFCSYCMYIQLNDSGIVKLFNFPAMAH